MHYNALSILLMCSHTYIHTLDKSSFAFSADYCKATARKKMECVYADVLKQRDSANCVDFKPAVIIAADTVVDVDNLTLEKPSDDEDSARMIRMLSGYDL